GRRRADRRGRARAARGRWPGGRRARRAEREHVDHVSFFPRGSRGRARGGPHAGGRARRGDRGRQLPAGAGGHRRVVARHGGVDPARDPGALRAHGDRGRGLGRGGRCGDPGRAGPAARPGGRGDFGRQHRRPSTGRGPYEWLNGDDTSTSRQDAADPSDGVRGADRGPDRGRGGRPGVEDLVRRGPPRGRPDPRDPGRRADEHSGQLRDPRERPGPDDHRGRRDGRARREVRELRDPAGRIDRDERGGAGGRGDRRGDVGRREERCASRVGRAATGRGRGCTTAGQVGSVRDGACCDTAQPPAGGAVAHVPGHGDRRGGTRFGGRGAGGAGGEAAVSEGGGRADVVIVGGGIIGCGIAWHLARRGVSVTVVERDRPGGHATWAAAGMLSPLGETASPGPFYDLVMASFRRYDAFVEALEEATGITVEYREAGQLCGALDESEAAELTERHRWQRAAGHEVELLDAGEARRLEPALAPSVVAGLLIPRDRQVDNRRLGRALWVAAARAGARFVLGDPVQSLWLDGPDGDPEGTGSAGGRVRGVALASGTRIEAPCVVLAAGSWSGRIPYAGRTLPVSPVGGQLLALETVPPVL